MTQFTDLNPAEAPVDVDLGGALQRLLSEHPDPLTPARIRGLLPQAFRKVSDDELTAALNRQVAANVLYDYPRYRGRQARFWAHPMPDHVARLVLQTLEEGALPETELRRKLPAYARVFVEAVVRDQLERGRLYRHPKSGRSKEKLATRPPDPKSYLRTELEAVFRRLEVLGFSASQVRAGALELLHDDEWTPSESTPLREEPAPSSANSTGRVTQG